MNTMYIYTNINTMTEYLKYVFSESTMLFEGTVMILHMKYTYSMALPLSIKFPTMTAFVSLSFNTNKSGK